jgi:hypothetical protein
MYIVIFCGNLKLENFHGRNVSSILIIKVFNASK